MGSFPFVEIVLNSTRYYRRGPQVDMSKHHIQSRFPSRIAPATAGLGNADSGNEIASHSVG